MSVLLGLSCDCYYANKDKTNLQTLQQLGKLAYTTTRWLGINRGSISKPKIGQSFHCHIYLNKMEDIHLVASEQWVNLSYTGLAYTRVGNHCILKYTSFTLPYLVTVCQITFCNNTVKGCAVSFATFYDFLQLCEKASIYHRWVPPGQRFIALDIHYGDLFKQDMQLHQRIMKLYIHSRTRLNPH